ncbi:ankyrin repeat-containing domain protein [Lasiosphaeria miniovina]|uniref:Ankyrin repeat-containing domain protein n=1 Tax=Lasiosphaeria miniovina TaxID=1954250 RepID=A0AA40ATU7_9PEZI|nr:ankyrin repeat-containing domain protein [Lasiosphaeria miniovina]KAK0721905.1 ankyrin repeat-containing domain protein [Lasiosphaeria miniovina]
MEGLLQHGTCPRLWEVAFDALSAEDKKDLEFARADGQLQPSEIVQVVEQKKQDCVKKQWDLYTNKAGEKVPVRDVLGKMVEWIDKFKQVGDMAVQFDPGHATIPWAVVKMLLQAAVNDFQTFGAMAESRERISCIIVRYTDLETRVLIRTSVLTSHLSTALVRLYSIGKTAKRMVEERLLRIEKDEDAVYKLATLVQNEISGVKLDDILRGIKQSVESFHAGQEDLVRHLLSRGVNVSQTGGQYGAAIVAAAAQARPSITALHHAARRGDLETARCLTERGADINAAAAAAATTQQTPMGLACLLGHGHVVTFLGALGAELEDATGVAAMQIAIRNGDKEMVSVLLSKGISPNAPFSDGRRPFHKMWWTHAFGDQGEKDEARADDRNIDSQDYYDAFLEVSSAVRESEIKDMPLS